MPRDRPHRNLLCKYKLAISMWKIINVCGFLNRPYFVLLLVVVEKLTGMRIINTVEIRTYISPM